MSENQYRLDPANKVIAEELRASGCAYPFAGADLILKALTEAGYGVFEVPVE